MQKSVANSSSATTPLPFEFLIRKERVSNEVLHVFEAQVVLELQAVKVESMKKCPFE